MPLVLLLALLTGARTDVLRNTRTTDSRVAAKSAEFLFGLVPRPAACALLGNSRTTDSRVAAKSAEFLFGLVLRPAAGALKAGGAERQKDFRDIAASGRAASIDSPDSRVGPPLPLTPGPPPLLSFRFYEGKQRHRFGDVDIMLDDAGH